MTGSRPYLDLRQHSFVSGLLLAFRFPQQVALHLQQEGLRHEYTTIYKASDGSACGVSPGAFALPASASLLERLRPVVCHLEDRRFFRHRGVDWIGVARAALINIRTLSIRQGASTLTQQLVRNLFVYPNRSLVRKLVEISIARRIERRFTKREIFKAYCESVLLGPGIRGFPAALRAYFRAAPDTASDGALKAVAGCLRTPMTTSPLVDTRKFARRAEQVQLFFGSGAASSARHAMDVSGFRRPRLAAAVKADLIQSEWSPDYIRVVHTTTSPALQHAMASALKTAFRDPDVANAAAIAISNTTGAVLAECSLRDGLPTEFSPGFAGNVQPGSTFKTFALLEALEQGIPASEKFESSPFEWRDPRFRGGAWRVRNFRDEYAGQRSLGSAFVTSDNSVFARLVQRIGPEALAARLRSFGLISGTESPAAHVLGAAASGIALSQLCRAYAGLATGVLPPKPYVIQRAIYFDGTIREFVPAGRTDLKLTSNALLDKYLARAGISSHRVKGKSGTVGASNLFAAYDDQASYAIWIGFRRSRSEWWDKGARAKSVLERMLDTLAGREFV